MSAPLQASVALPFGVSGYIQLLKQNRNVRNLWIGQVISDMGDWFNTVAVLGLLQQLTSNNPALVSLYTVLQMMPSAIAGLFVSGWIVDRFDRRHIIVVMHVVRAAIATLYLFARTPETVWLVFAATIGLSLCNSIYQPASSAAMPNLCQPGELAAANALQQSTFASVVFIGAFVGGIVAQVLGRDVAFVINALSFVWAAWWAFTVRGNFSDPNRTALGGGSVLRVLTEGARYLSQHRRVMMFTLIKPVWAATFGASGLFSAFSYGIYQAGDLGTSWLYGGRGVGAFVGPLILAGWFMPKSMRDFARIMLASQLVLMLGYAIFGLSTAPWVGTIGTFIGHIGGASVWTFSRLYIQRETPDHVRGRVLSLDQTMFWMSTSLATLALGTLASRTTLPFAVLAGVATTGLLITIWSVVALSMKPEPLSSPAPRGQSE